MAFPHQVDAAEQGGWRSTGVNDRRVLNGIFWVLRSGAPWRDLPDSFGPYTTLRSLATGGRLDPDHDRVGDQA